MEQHVFISYARADQQYADELALELSKQGFKVWIDREIHYSEHWSATLEEAVQNCGALIVIMTPEAEGSSWVSKELSLAMAGSKPIFPLLLKGEVFHTLATLQYADVRNNAMPEKNFLLDLGAVPGVKPTVVQKLEEKRRAYEKTMEKTNPALKELFKRYEIESGMIDDPEEIKRWENFKG